jgi:hypothetical protein
MWMELVGSCESLLEIAGARQVVSSVLSGALDGHTYAVLEARWQ